MGGKAFGIPAFGILGLWSRQGPGSLQGLQVVHVFLDIHNINSFVYNLNFGWWCISTKEEKGYYTL